MRTKSKPLVNTICDESRLCLHISTDHFRAPKVCVLNHECFHCAYDQWLDYMETGNKMGKRSETAGGFLLLSA